NPFRGVEKIQGQPRRPLTDAEFQSLLRHASVWKKRRRNNGRYASGRKVCPSDRKRRQRPSRAARFRQVLVFLRFTGCRPGRPPGWSGPTSISRPVSWSCGGTRRARRPASPGACRSTPVVLKLLIFIKRLNQPGNHVFLTHRKAPWHRVRLAQRLRRCREVAGVPDDAVLYGLRHAFGTRAILRGVDLKTLSELMGHTTTRMTEHYVALAGQREQLAAAMEKISGSSTPAATSSRPGS